MACHTSTAMLPRQHRVLTIPERSKPKCKPKCKRNYLGVTVAVRSRSWNSVELDHMPRTMQSMVTARLTYTFKETTRRAN